MERKKGCVTSVNHTTFLSGPLTAPAKAFNMATVTPDIWQHTLFLVKQLFYGLLILAGILGGCSQVHGATTARLSQESGQLSCHDGFLTVHGKELDFLSLLTTIAQQCQVSIITCDKLPENLLVDVDMDHWLLWSAMDELLAGYDFLVLTSLDSARIGLMPLAGTAPYVKDAEQGAGAAMVRLHSSRAVSFRPAPQGQGGRKLSLAKPAPSAQTQTEIIYKEMVSGEQGRQILALELANRDTNESAGEFKARLQQEMQEAAAAAAQASAEAGEPQQAQFFRYQMAMLQQRIDSGASDRDFDAARAYRPVEFIHDDRKTLAAYEMRLAEVLEKEN